MQEEFYVCPDGTKLRYAWFRGAEARGTVLCLQGRRECLEIYSEQIAAWNARGFDVVGFDWRGQGGSGRPLDDPHKQHVLSFDIYREDVQGFYTDIVRPNQRGPLIVYAHSMGGFIALDWLVHAKPDVKGAVLLAPMLALPVPSLLYGPLLALSAAAIGLGFGEHYTPSEERFDPDRWIFEGNHLTHDGQRFRLIPACFAARPELALGGITFGWLHAALGAIVRVRGELHQTQVPVLVLNGGQDHVVLSHELSAWAHHIPNVTEKIYPAARHVVMMETDDLRARAWGDIGGWLEMIGGFFEAKKEMGSPPARG